MQCSNIHQMLNRQCKEMRLGCFARGSPRCIGCLYDKERHLAVLGQGTKRKLSPLVGAVATSQGGDVVYKDSLTDIAFIALCRKAYGKLAGWQSDKNWWEGEETYAGMVAVSRALMKGKNADEQQSTVIAGFPRIPSWFRQLFPYSSWGAEFNAFITPIFFRWLVGPMETADAVVNGKTQRSSVKIKQCRYLHESACVGMCVNLCKSPVQTFFTEELGMPLTMKPNFEDCSCEMVFGEVPPSREDDEAYHSPCFTTCPAGLSDKSQCPSLQ